MSHHFLQKASIFYRITKVYILEVKTSAISKQYFGPNADWEKKRISAISAWVSSKGPSILYNVEDLPMFFFTSVQGV